MLALRPKQNTFISTMTPQVFLDLDEKGAVAAAVTTMLGSVVVTGHITKPPPIPFFVDHPVVFRIRDKQTGTILFAGRVASPTSRWWAALEFHAAQSNARRLDGTAESQQHNGSSRIDTADGRGVIRGDCAVNCGCSPPFQGDGALETSSRAFQELRPLEASARALQWLRPLETRSR